MRMIKKAVFLSSLFLATTLLCFGQKRTNDSLQALIEEMAERDVYEISYTVGFAGTISKQHLRFRQLKSLATETQLVALAAENKSAVVRLYSFQALKQQHYNISHSLLKQFRNDQTIVATLNGCIGGKKPVSELAKQNLVSADYLKTSEPQNPL